MIPKLVFLLLGTQWKSSQMWYNTCRILKRKFLLRWHVTDGPQKERPFWGTKHHLSDDTFNYWIKEGGITQRKMIEKNFRGTDAINCFLRQQRLKETRNLFWTSTSIDFQWSIFPTFWDSIKLKVAMSLTKAAIITILQVLINLLFLPLEYLRGVRKYELLKRWSTILLILPMGKLQQRTGLVMCPIGHIGSRNC